MLLLVLLVISALTGVEVLCSHPAVCPAPCLCDASLQHVNCSNGHLTSVHHLPLPPSLISLMLDQNSISSLPATSIHSLKHIQFLAANHNNITRLGNGSLCAHNKLLHLFLEYNQIAWIEPDYLKDCQQLVTLELRSNYLYIEDMAFVLQYVPELTTLVLSNNQFFNNTILPSSFSSLKNLKYFYIDEMQEVRTIGPDFFLYLNTSSFKEFSLARNMISSVSNETFVNMKDLDFLDISQIRISSENLRDIFFVLGQTMLQKLNMRSIFIDRNKDEVIGNHFFKHMRGASVHVLHAEGNYAGFGGRLEKSSLVGLQHLHELYLDDNQLHWIHARALAHLSRLKVLSLKHNLLSCTGGCEFLSHLLPQLTTLKLSNNVIDNSLEEILFHDSGLPKLKHLYLDRNKLKLLNPLTFILPYLHSLDISENRISYIETGTFSTMSELKTLKINDCIHLKELNPKVFAGLYNLETLTLNNNRLSKLDSLAWFGLSSLKHLELSNNKLRGSEGSPLNLEIPSEKMSVLDLSNNNIRSISLPEMSLESLVLKYNHISNIESIYNNIPGNLINLDLSYNYLQNLPGDFLHNLSDIQNVVLEGNPWYCDCDGVPLQTWLQTQVPDSKLLCSGPIDKAGLTIVQEDLCTHHSQVILPLMITFILLFLLVSVILAAVICHYHPGFKLKHLLKPKDKTKSRSPRQSIQTVEEDTELKESLSGSSQCLNINYCLASEEAEGSSHHGREPLMFYSQDVQSSI